MAHASDDLLDDHLSAEANTTSAIYIRSLEKKFNALNNKSKVHFEIAAILLTLAFPLLFVWTPFSTDNYGLEDIWCGIIVR